MLQNRLYCNPNPVGQLDHLPLPRISALCDNLFRSDVTLFNKGRRGNRCPPLVNLLNILPRPGTLNRREISNWIARDGYCCRIQIYMLLV